MKNKQQYVVSMMLAMKFTISQFVLSAIFVFSLYANDGKSQADLSRTFSVNVTNIEIADLLRTVSKQTKIKFSYSFNAIEAKRVVNYSAKEKKLKDFLDEFVKQLGVGYKIVDDQVILFPIKELKVSTGNINANQPDPTINDADREVTGKVQNEKGEPIAGATVTQKGTNNAVVTSNDGSFSINIKTENATLIITSIGFSSKEIVLGENEARVNVVLNTEIMGLDEVIVVGYGSQRKKDLSGSVVSVKVKDLNTVNAVSVDNLLQGRVAGLNVNTYTAQPGGGIAINIRGSISPLGGSTPLYVIDGVALTTNRSTDFTQASGSSGERGFVDRNPLNNINPNDIESITVLKDASATAIYGSAAANGVILITTKRGKEGKPVISYSGSYAIQNMAPYVEVFNAKDFMINANRFGAERRLFDNGIAPYYGTNIDNGSVPAFNPLFTQQQIDNAGAGTDWIDLITRRGRISDHNISMTAGSANTKIFASFNMFDQQSLMNFASLRRFIGRINLDQKIGESVVFKLGLSYSQIDNNNVNSGSTPNQERDAPSLLNSAFSFAPTIEPFNDRGELNQSYNTRTNNPLGYGIATNTSLNKRLFINPSIEYQITNGLKASVVAGIDQTSTSSDYFVPRAARFELAPTGIASLGQNTLNNYSVEGFLNYDKSFNNDKHRFAATFGGGYYTSTSKFFGLEAVDFFTDVFGTANVAIANNRELARLSSSRMSPPVKVSQFARLNYALNDKYLFDFSMRYDGSSRFGADRRYGFFPGVSAAWKIDQEGFFSRFNKKISELKFRASYGTSGNDFIQGNPALSLYGPGFSTAPWNYLFGNQINTGILQIQQGNPLISWETNITFNIGLDFGILNNRIKGSVEYFNRTAKDLLDFAPLPSNAPINRVGTNVGSTNSKGIEIALNTINVQTKRFSWTSNITLGTFKATWVERNQFVTLAPYIKENDPINAVYGWRTNGIIRTPAELESVKGFMPNARIGNLRYVDVNNDNKMDIDDVVNLGDFNAKGTFGLNNVFTLKSFDLSLFIYGSYGGLSWDGWQTFNQSYNIGGLTPVNGGVRTTDVTTTFNPNGKYPSIGIDQTANNNPTRGNDFTMITTYFARLKNITLGYTMSDKILGNKKIFQSARFFVDIANLGVLTNFVGLDPEMERGNLPFPIARTLTFGFNTKF